MKTLSKLGALTVYAYPTVGPPILLQFVSKFRYSVFAVCNLKVKTFNNMQ